MPFAPAPPSKTSEQLFKMAARYAERARAARSEAVRRAYEKLADRFRVLAVQRQAEEKGAEPPAERTTDDGTS